MAFPPDSAYLAAASGAATCVWRVSTGRLAARVADPGGAGAFAVAISSDGHAMATGDDNGSVYLWRITSE